MRPLVKLNTQVIVSNTADGQNKATDLSNGRVAQDGNLELIMNKLNKQEVEIYNIRSEMKEIRKILGVIAMQTNGSHREAAD